MGCGDRQPGDAPMPPKILGARELAETLDANYGDLLSWTRRGLIPSIKSGGRYFYDLRRVLEALRTQEAEMEEAALCP